MKPARDQSAPDQSAADKFAPDSGPRFIHEVFDQRLAATPELVFLHTLDPAHPRYTLAELGAWVNQLADELRASGVVAGDRVLVVAENCPEHVALILACSRVGAWSCGVNARMSRGEITAFADKADPRVVYFTSQVSDAAQLHALAAQAQPSVLPGLQRSPPRRHAVAGFSATDDVANNDADHVAAIIFTSGTTGTPKGVLVTHQGLLQFGRISAASRGLGPGDRSYAFVPMTHIFGLATVLLASLTAGSSLVMRSKFDPADAYDALARHGVSNLQGPPAMFTRLLAWAQSQREALGAAFAPTWPALHYMYTGAAPLDLSLKRAVEAHFGMPLHHGYGLSEYAGALCVVRHNEWRDDTSAGYLIEGAELRTVSNDGGDVLAGVKNEDGSPVVGEIWMRGPGLMPGYFRDAEATAQVMRPGGWYASGDLGYQGVDGALFVVGRLKEMIIRSGFNVYPGEVEAVLMQFPGVQRAAVVGRKESDGNEAVLAFIEMTGNAQIDRVGLNAHLADNLAPYKRPASITQLDALPMTQSGKIMKRALLDSPNSPNLP